MPKPQGHNGLKTAGSTQPRCAAILPPQATGRQLWGACPLLALLRSLPNPGPPCCSGNGSDTAEPSALPSSDPPSKGTANDSSALLTLEEVIERTKLSRRKLLNDKAAGALPYIQFGRSIRYDPVDIDTYINRRRVKARPGLPHQQS